MLQPKKIFFILLIAAQLYSQQKDTLKFECIYKELPFGLSQKIMVGIPKVGLALSGGGARSLSQIGILRALEEKNIPIDIIVGTSMGSIVGGLYSAGYSVSELDSIVRAAKWNDLFAIDQSDRNELFVDQKVTEDRALVSFRIDDFVPLLPKSLSTGQRGAGFLNLLSLNAPIQTENFDNLLFKYRAVSTDLIFGREIILDGGPLGTAMQASSSVTFLLPPVKKDTLMLVDGGLVANIPVKETRRLGADIVIAGNSVSPLYQKSELNYPWIIADQLVSIPMQILNEQQLEEADFVIQPELNGVKNSDFFNIDSLIDKGYNAAIKKVDEIEKEFARQFKRNIVGNGKIYRNIFIKEIPEDLKFSFFTEPANRDSISNREILYQLYLIQRTGNYKNVFAEIETFGNASFLSVFVEKNSDVFNYEIVGVSVFDREWLAQKLSTLINKPFNVQQTIRAALAILKEYKDRGFLLARIDKINFDETRGTLHIKINEGKIAKVIIRGNGKTKEEVITRELDIKPGEYLKIQEAEKGLANLRSTNLFEQIELAAEPTGEENNVYLNFIERPSSVLRLGMRIDNENFTQLSFDVRDENFLGTGTEIGAIFSGGVRNRSFVLEHRANRVFDTYLTYKLRAFYDFNDVNVYRNDSSKAHNRFSRSKDAEYRQIFFGGSFGIGTQVGRFGNFFVEGKYERDIIKNKSNFAGDIYEINISSIRFSLSIDSQNKYPYPTDGFLIKTFYETAQTALGGDIGYTKFLFDYKSILGLNDPNAFIFRGIIGFADATLPLSQQFSLGGQNTFMGFRENEFRGRQVMIASLEYSHKLPFKIFFDTYVKTRYDIGSIWAQREQIRYKDLKHGIGVTLSFNTPIGPADFSIGKSFYLKDAIPNNTIVWGPAFLYFTIGYYY